jgi:hypothetical protein
VVVVAAVSVVVPVEDMVRDNSLTINTIMMLTPFMKVRRKKMKKTYWVALMVITTILIVFHW